VLTVFQHIVNQIGMFSYTGLSGALHLYWCALQLYWCARFATVARRWE